MKFMTSPRGRITTQAPGVMEQGYTICSRVLCTFFETAPSMLRRFDRAGTLDFGIPSNQKSGTVHHLSGISHKVR